MNPPLLAPASADALLFDLGRVVLDIDFEEVMTIWAGHAGCAPDDVIARLFRPLIADSAVLMAVNNGEVDERSFVMKADGCNLTSAGRRAFIATYERRLEHVIQHPIFGYKASWRRILEVQARLLGRHMTGEIPRYVPIETR